MAASCRPLPQRGSFRTAGGASSRRRPPLSVVLEPQHARGLLGLEMLNRGPTVRG